MNNKLARITNDKKLFLSHEIVEGDKFSLNADGTFTVPELIEGEGFSFDETAFTTNELVEGYPLATPVIDDSLMLWLEGNTEKSNDNIWRDLSGKGNDAELVDFQYDNANDGWVHDGLKFDGADDYVQLPDIELNPDGFAIQKNNQIVVFDGDMQKTIDSGEIKTVGRNLLRQSQSGLIITGADDASATSVSNTVNSDGFNETLVTAIIDTSNANYRYKFIQSLLSEFPETNTDYVLSFDYKTNNSTSGVWIDTRDSGNATGSVYEIFNCTNTNEQWQRGYVVCNWNITTQVNSLLLIDLGDTPTINDYIAVRKFKFEKGSTATEWTPAPEDVLAGIGQLDEKILYDYKGRNLLILKNLVSYTPYSTMPTIDSLGTISTTAVQENPFYLAISCNFIPEKNSIYTITGNMKINDSPINENSLYQKKASTYNASNLHFSVNEASGHFEITEQYSGINHWLFHTPITPIVVGDVITIESLKFECGDTATPWSPAPEDVRTVQRYMIYNRALTDDEIIQNYQARHCSPHLALQGVDA